MSQVTVLIPTYRRPRLLARALASVVEQQGVDACVHVFDNASQDGTADVVRDFASRHPGVRYHVHERNLGPIANFDFALRSVDTPFFSILSDDDYLLPGFLARAVATLEAAPRAAFWGGITLTVDEGGTIFDARVERWPREGLFEPPEGALCLTGGMAPIWTGVLFRRSALEAHGLPDFSMSGPADLDYLIRLACRESYVIDKTPAAVFMLNPASFSATEPLSSFWPGWRTMIGNVAREPGLTPDERARLLEALEHDARRMLWRRGANAIAEGRLAFATEAAGHLRRHYGASAPAAALRLLGFACRVVPGAQALATWAYRRAEKRLVRSRAGLAARYGALLRGD